MPIAAVQTADADPSASPIAPHAADGPLVLPASVWRGSELGGSAAPVVASGWAGLDQELPGAGWPCRSLTEVLAPQPGVLEWRLVGPALRGIAAAGGQVVVVGAPKLPHLPGLRHEGIEARNLVWIRAETPAERLWVTEQLIRANSAGAILAWLPQARQEQIRRLQIGALACDGPVFLFRPEAAQHESSAAPLRLRARHALDWALEVQVFKRRGPAHIGTLTLPSVPGGLTRVLTPRLLRPSQLLSTPSREAAHALGRAVARATTRELAH